MSRSFPYPPPGYTLSAAKYESWMELIKLQVEREYKKAEKQRRREKKEKRRGEKKEKRREREERKRHEKDEANKEDLDKSDTPKGHIVEKLCLDNKRSKAETYELDHSSLSEEHGQAVVTSSCANSHKRKRLLSSTDNNYGKFTSHYSCPGQVFLSQMPSPRQYEFVALPMEQQPCTTSSLTESSPQSNAASSTCHVNTAASNSDEAFSVGSESFPKAAATSSGKVELQYTSLFKNSIPAQIQYVWSELDQLDWLWNRSEEMRSTKRQRLGQYSASCSGSSAPWPCAKYLDGISVYALPYAVPF